MNKHVKLAVLITLTIIPITLSASDMSPQEVKSLIQRADKNMFPSQYEAYVLMMDYKLNNKTTEELLHVYRKEDKMLAVFLSPPIQKGQAFIRNGDDMWSFLPTSKKVIRIGAKDKSMGGEASNGDILRVDLAEDYTGTYLGDEIIEGKLCYKLELKAKNRSISYDRIVYWINKQKEIPVKREYYTFSGKKIKTSYFQNLQSINGSEIPCLVIFQNEINRQYKTEMVIQDLNSNVQLNDSMFTPAYAKRGNLR